MAVEMNVNQVVYVDFEESTVCCRGVNKALGHPAVYLSFEENTDSVQCYYCGRDFKRKQLRVDNI